MHVPQMFATNTYGVESVCSVATGCLFSKDIFSFEYFEHDDNR